MRGEGHFRITLRRGTAGASHQQLATLAGMGLKRRGQSVLLRDAPSIRGMVIKVVHMVMVEPLAGRLPPSPRMRADAGRERGQAG